MPYTPNPNDATEPLDSRPAGTAAEEFRALKAVVLALAVSASASAGPRQVVQSAVLDANGLNNAITTGAGLRPGLTASATDPYHLTYASGFSAGKALNFEESVEANNADILGADLPANNTSLIYRNYGSTYGSTLVPPQYGYAFDRTQGALLNFEGADAAITTTDDFGNQWTFNGNAQLDTAQFKFGTSSLLLDGTGDYIESTNFTTLGPDSWEICGNFRFAALPAAGQDMMLWVFGPSASNFGVRLSLNNTAGTLKLNNAISSNGTSFDIANGVLGTNTVWAINTWYRIRMVFDALAGTYRTYLSIAGAAESQDFTVSSTARVAAIGRVRLGYDNAASLTFFNGWIDAFRFLRCATKTTTETPAVVAPTIADYPYHFFNIPKMKMYEVTAASAAANTDPTLTPRTRLFLGEADTSGAAVTAVRNYAIRGEYVNTFGLVAGTPNTLNHNIGTDYVDTEVDVRRNDTSVGAGSGFGWLPCMRAYYYNGAANEQRAVGYRVTKNVVDVYPGVTSPSGVGDDGSLISVTIGRVRMRRAF